MIILITGATHTGKTLLTKTLIEKYKYRALSIDHLKMGLIRSGYTKLTPYDDDKLTSFLWPVVREMIKTAIENEEDLIVEGAYIPNNWKEDFSKSYLDNIRLIVLAMSESYIKNHFNDILKYESVVEKRLIENDITINNLIEENNKYINDFKDDITIINNNYMDVISKLCEEI